MLDLLAADEFLHIGHMTATGKSALVRSAQAPITDRASGLVSYTDNCPTTGSASKESAM